MGWVNPSKTGRVKGRREGDKQVNIEEIKKRKNRKGCIL